MTLLLLLAVPLVAFLLMAALLLLPLRAMLLVALLPPQPIRERLLALNRLVLLHQDKRQAVYHRQTFEV
jgi:hypothetical protein